MFPPTSRYFGIPIATWTTPTGEEIVYLRRRFLPDPATLNAGLEHLVVQGDRLDNVSFEYLRDPEAFWRICDANRSLRPADLTAEPGRRILVPLPSGV